MTTGKKVRNLQGALPLPLPAAATPLAAAILAISLAGCGDGSGVPRGSSSLVSWNRNVATRPVPATISEILGAETNAAGGATWAGGWHGGISLADHRHWVNRQVVSGADQRRLVPPPASVAGVPIFVEVDNVAAVSIYDNGGVPGTDHDTSANVCAVGRPRGNLACIRVEIDGQWKARGWAPTDFPLNTPIDIQGYLYWDTPHASEGDPLNSAPSGYRLGHYETGWEIHPVSAWRLHKASH